ncbi:Uncharacterised protein [Enterobacter kobei]|nr:Uncharacterised protein [Enterobacter kobei]
MTFIKDRHAYRTAILIISNYGNDYYHIAKLFMRKAYGA